MKIDYDKLRNRFIEDSSFGESFFKMSTELEDVRIDEVKVGSRLPFDIKVKDPELLIAYIKGFDNDKNRDFECVIYEECEKSGLLQRFYVDVLLERYTPVTDEDFDRLPDIWGVTFTSEEEGDIPIFHVRSMCNAGSDDAFEVDTGDKANLINTNADSDIMRLVKQAKLL